MRVGFLDDIGADRGFGWFYSLDTSESPLVLVDGAAVEILNAEIARPDVCEALGVENVKGFSYALPKGRRNHTVTLYAVSGAKISQVDRKRLTGDKTGKDYNFFRALVRARELSANPDAVAITCWDGTHNPIGRAKVLYDIAALKRPAMLFAYEFSEFGAGIWPPLANVDFDYMLIPWETRELYHEILSRNGVVFDNIWMCKPRLPTFLLSHQFSHAETRLVLDFDDNEEHFSRSAGSRGRPYGETTVGLSDFVTGQVMARTCASATLKQRYAGEIVRHARAKGKASRRPAANGPIKFGFIGTVRPHKGIDVLAKALKIASMLVGQRIDFHVLGTIEPAKFKDDLRKLGVTVGGVVPAEELSDRIEEMDFLITGYPHDDEASAPVTEYQITAKIGDALANGRAVFVPRTNAVRDLEGTPGIYLFDGDDFAFQVRRALDDDAAIRLPREFTFEHGSKTFEKQLALAGRSSRASQALKMVSSRELPQRAARGETDSARRSVLLVWKQHDGGLYGRRIDQIARAIKARNPNFDVAVLQLLSEQTEKDYQHRARSHTSEFSQVLRNIREGGGRRELQGVVYRTIRYAGEASLVPLVSDFLVDSQILPENSVVVLFPVIKSLNALRQTFSQYRIIVDVVDNQFGWSKKKDVSDMIAAYAETLSLGEHIVFNSAINRNFFARSFGDVVREKELHTIPNWYAYPPVEKDTSVSRVAVPEQGDTFNIVYSGNLNDRVNFNLIKRITALSDRVRFFLMGTADRVGEDFYDLLKRNVVYLGPTAERATIEMLKIANLAVMPHVDDDVSRFMNPLKLHMYQYFKLPCVSSNVSGITVADSSLTVCENDDEFLEAVAGHYTRWESGIRLGSKKLALLPAENEDMVSYCNLIESYLVADEPEDTAEGTEIRVRSPRSSNTLPLASTG